MKEGEGKKEGKYETYKSSGRDFKLGVPSQISGSLKNLKPGKIGL